MTSKVGLMPLPFTGGFYKSRSKPLSSQGLVNWYVNVLDSAGLSEANLYATAGLRQAIAEVGGINRGAWVMNDIPYFVNGNTLFKMNRVVSSAGDITYTSTSIATINGSGRVIMDNVKLQLCIVVPGVEAGIYTEGGSFVAITDPNFAGPVDDVVAIDSVFVFITTGTNVVFHSAINNGLSYNALDNYPVNQMDFAVGLMAYKNILYVMGQDLTVQFTNVGGNPFLFNPLPNSVIATGLRSKHLKTPFLDSIVWLGAGLNASISVWLYSGGAPRNISTEPIDFLLQNATDEEMESAFMLRHSENGADFIVLSFGNYCLEYNLAASARLQTPIWQERRSTVSVNGSLANSPWRVKSIVQAYNRVFVGDAVDGRIGEMVDSIGNEYGNKILRSWDSMPMSVMGIKGKVKAFEVFTDVGIADDDVMNLSWSNDGGFTFENKLSRSLGAIGEYGRRVFWSRLGQVSIARQWRLEYSGPYPRGINKIMVNVQ